MKIAALLLASLAIGGLGAYHLSGGTCPLQMLCSSFRDCGDDGPVSGRYVEARTASVFAGACHYNGEVVTGGREAALAWSLKGGGLDGVEVVAVVAADKNLAEADARRRAVVYLDQGLGARQRDAALGYLRERHAAALGEIVEVKLADVDVSLDGERYDVRVGELLTLRGAALPDRACCSMPTEVWYKPQVELAGQVVGNSEVFAFQDPVLGPVWSRKGDNDAFVGKLGSKARCAPTPCGEKPAAQSDALVYEIF